jgi:RNA-binding protein YlmH
MNSSEEKLLLAKIDDLFSLCDKYSCARFSDFLDGAEQAVISDKAIMPYGCNVMLYGGFDEAEKKIMGVFPEWQEPDKNDFPMKCIKIEGGFTRKLTHRDYLGTIMSLGISPSKLGDIVVDDGFAYVFLHEDIADYVADSVNKIGNQGVKVTELENMNDIKVERKYKVIGAVCASERLDAVVGAAAKVSRSVSQGLIEGGKVKVNHREICKPSETIKEGDLLSVRGYGRFLVDSFGGETRKNRLHIVLKQYI